MELRELKTFQKVAILLSFNLAADALHYAQSTVSAQIKSLEDDLGVPLFHRLGKKISLTEAGENLLKHSQRLLAMVEETYTATTGRGMLEGSLSIRVPQTVAAYYLPDINAFIIHNTRYTYAPFGMGIYFLHKLNRASSSSNDKNFSIIISFFSRKMHDKKYRDFFYKYSESAYGKKHYEKNTAYVFEPE